MDTRTLRRLVTCRREVAAVVAILFAIIIPFLWAQMGEADARGASPRLLRAEVVAAYPHDETAFTQGLVLYRGVLYESTGRYGRSVLREVDVTTGKIRRQVRLAPTFFGEGLALVGDRLLQLTWREGIALAYNVNTLAPVGTFGYLGEGWGLCFDGTQLVMSDGSNRLSFRNPTTFAATGQLAVTMQGQPVVNLNELECVATSVYANVWMTETIVEIDRGDGRVSALIDASGLLSREERVTLSPEALLNGIAYDASSGTFLITGKLWPKLFRVRFVPR